MCWAWLLTVECFSSCESGSSRPLLDLYISMYIYPSSAVAGPSAAGSSSRRRNSSSSSWTPTAELLIFIYSPRLFLFFPFPTFTLPLLFLSYGPWRRPCLFVRGRFVLVDCSISSINISRVRIPESSFFLFYTLARRRFTPYFNRREHPSSSSSSCCETDWKFIVSSRIERMAKTVLPVIVGPHSVLLHRSPGPISSLSTWRRRLPDFNFFR